MEKIRIMTHNQWLCNDNRPAWEAMGMDCSARVRERGFARLYAETAPDIVGIQEISGLMAEELMAALEERDLRYALLWGHDPHSLPAGSLRAGGFRLFAVSDRTGGL